MFVKRNIAESAKAGLTPRELCCVLWATKGLSFELVDDPIFRAQFGSGVPPGLNAHTLSSEMKELGQKVQREIYARLQGEAVTVGVDGWTNTRHRYPRQPHPPI